MERNALNLHFIRTVREVRKVLLKTFLQFDGNIAAHSHILANDLLSLHHTHTHTLSRTQSWSSGCSGDDLAIIYSSCQFIVYCGSAQLPSPPPPHAHSHTHTSKRCKWHPSFSLPLQPLPNYHGTEAVIKSLLWRHGSKSPHKPPRDWHLLSRKPVPGFSIRVAESRKDGYNVG